MTTVDLRSQIAKKLDMLSPSLLAVANDFVESLLAESRQDPSTGTVEVEEDSEEDPLIGLIDGSPDLADEAEDILQEIKSGSGWTWRQ